MSMVRPRPMEPFVVKSRAKRRTGLRKVSDKLKKSLAAYHKITKPLWLELHPRCQFSIVHGVSCGKTRGVTVHHARGRGRYLNNPNWFFTLCRKHHRYCHDNPAFSYEYGYMVKRWEKNS